MATALLVAIGLTGGTTQLHGQVEHEGEVQGRRPVGGVRDAPRGPDAGLWRMTTTWYTDYRNTNIMMEQTRNSVTRTTTALLFAGTIVLEVRPVAGMVVPSLTMMTTATRSKAFSSSWVDGRSPAMTEMTGRGPASWLQHPEMRDHHRFLLKGHLARIDQLTRHIKEMDSRIVEVTRPFEATIDLFRSIPGVAARSGIRRDRGPLRGSRGNCRRVGR